MPDIVFIYGLLEPDTGKLRYIGKAENPQARLAKHLCDKNPSHRKNWLSSLKERGLRPVIQLLLEVPKEDWKFWECDLISFFRAEGFDLVNGTAGGEGWSGHHSESTKRKLAEKSKGNKNCVGRKQSAQAIEKIKEARKKQTFSLEYRKKASERMRGNTWALGNTLSIDTRQQMSTSSKGKKKSLKHCENIRLAKLRYWAEYRAKKAGNPS